MGDYRRQEDGLAYIHRNSKLMTLQRQPASALTLSLHFGHLARRLSLALARTSISRTVEAINHRFVNVVLLHEIAEAHDGGRLLRLAG